MTLLDSAALIALYVLYLRRVAVIGGEGPPPVGVAEQAREPAGGSGTPCSGPARSSGAVLLAAAVSQ